MAFPKTHDSLHRRKRTKPVSTGKRVTPQPRDILWFQKLHEHGPLTSSYLHAFSKHICKSPGRARDRLTDLFNEARTPERAPYLIRPEQQFYTLDARYQELVYDISLSAENVLQGRGHWHRHAGGASGPWRHRHLVASITASIELATLKRNDINFIHQHKILSRADTTLRCNVPFINSATGKTEKRDLIPDALFGLEYIKDNKSAYRFFVVEADRGTEPTKSSKFNRKSHLRSFLQYENYIAKGLYKDHLKLTAGLLVLNVVVHETTMNAMQNLLNKLYPRGNAYHLFQTVDENLIRSLSDMSAQFDPLGSWQRSGHDNLIIG